MRVAICVVAGVAVLAACFLWVFPAIAPLMPFNATTIEATGAGPVPGARTAWLLPHIFQA